MQADLFKESTVGSKSNFADPSFASNKSLPVHRWVPWIAGFSSDFVDDIIDHELNGQGTVLDPFAGVGTTLVEATFKGYDAIGFEIIPYAALACRVKLEAGRIDTDALAEETDRLRTFCKQAQASDRTPKRSAPAGFRTRRDFYSPAVMCKVLTIQDFIDTLEEGALRDLFQIAFASTMISYSNYSYEPSLGTRKAAGKPEIDDADVAGAVISKLKEMQVDVQWVQENTLAAKTSERVIPHSFFECQDHIEANVADVAITSPPYLNNYHYIRNTRPHMYWLGFVEKPKDTKPMEHDNFGKYWQTVRGEDPVELDFPNPPSELIKQLEHLRTLKPDKGVYGGSGWANYAATYFNDSHRFAQSLLHALKPGAAAYIVIGNSILQGEMIPTDEYFAEICRRAGLELEGVHTPRSERVGSSIIQSAVRVTAAKKSDSLYESVVVLRKPE